MINIVDKVYCKSLRRSPAFTLNNFHLLIKSRDSVVRKQIKGYRQGGFIMQDT
jgi:hypothetical protein